ncbi:hypothetical protein R5R35_002491 [Gryllus longicercus]|uniref:Uncharacterized protein n=1 Tax=Gryllus longicercus TaxID=2509291 RepID=A0AAN9VFP0_9ORTH
MERVAAEGDARGRRSREPHCDVGGRRWAVTGARTATGDWTETRERRSAREREREREEGERERCFLKRYFARVFMSRFGKERDRKKRGGSQIVVRRKKDRKKEKNRKKKERKKSHNGDREMKGPAERHRK